MRRNAMSQKFFTSIARLLGRRLVITAKLYKILNFQRLSKMIEGRGKGGGLKDSLQVEIKETTI